MSSRSQAARCLSSASAGSSEREYDLVLFGATGFSGKLCAEYLMRAHGDEKLRVALAGRDRAKLEAVAASLPGKATPRVVVADAMSPDDMRRLAASTEVVASTAGPFRKFGSELVGACAAEGASYADITGEATWVAHMAHAHDATAKASGAALVPAAGFDSVPSDIGTLLAIREHEKTYGEAPERVDAYVTAMRGAAFRAAPSTRWTTSCGTRRRPPRAGPSRARVPRSTGAAARRFQTRS